MTDASENWLVATRLSVLIEAIESAGEDAARDALWADADRLLGEAEAEEDAELALPVWDRDLAAVRVLLAAWEGGTAPLCEHDKGVLRRAFKAYKKRLKLIRLDDESTAGANPLSAGRESSILGVKAPEQYPAEVWALLVRQKKLRDGGGGLFELATG